MTTRTWSAQQEAIFAWFKNGLYPAVGGTTLAAKNLVVRARAGTGKTTTIIEALKYSPSQRILLAAFNKKIAEELKARITNPNAEAKTLHALGYGFVQRYWPNTRPDSNRGYVLAREACGGDAAPDDMVTLVAKLASKGKAMLPGTGEEFADIANDFDLVPDDDWVRDGWSLERVVMHAFTAMQLACTKRDGTIDFDDMIYLPVANKWARARYDEVIIDEAQDMNASQLKLAVAVCEPTGRICVVGDDRQGIYAFRGADSGSIDRLKAELGAAELGLTVTYRCAKSIVAEAKVLVPDYQAAPDAPAGFIDGSRETPGMSIEALPERAAAGDFILSRKNAPLAKLCLRLLRMGKRAKVEGRDVGAGFKALIKKLRPKSIPDFLKRLASWQAKQQARARKLAKNPEAAYTKEAEIIDTAETLSALADGMAGLKELNARIDELFTDDVAAQGSFIVCSSIHRAKGRETDRVFVLAETLYPGKRTNLEEQNIHYVAVTRAKSTLVWVKGV